MVTVQKNDFIELEFTGIVKDTQEIFDTTNKDEAKKIGMQNPEKVKPAMLSVGNSMTVKGLDADLSGKEVGKEYSIELKAEDAFGKRNPSMVKMIPLKLFLEQRIMPEKGMQLSLDGMVVKIVSVSGGRVLVDFNNPLSGKTIIYKYKISRKLEDQKEKINALQDFFFRKTFDFEVKEKDLIMKVDKNMQKFVEMMAKPFEEILGLKVKVEVFASTQSSKVGDAKAEQEIVEKKEEKKEEAKK
ncbi:Putative FKBP-type peptidyl-prolyl cis-trans isomerase [uncultured archaeon]|nr:Putative FKBP-type peptidyl-prolyl cis-trans isomerase [uncultured archaeon]